ncbi:MAG: hypothetical protein ACKV2T_22615 [Kofleriaceae bacterium]
MKTLIVISSVAAIGCLGPQVSDRSAPTGHLLPAGSIVPSAEEDLRVREQIRVFDGVDELVPLHNGFAAGSSMRIWSFGPTVDFAAPVYMLVQRDGATVTRVPHNTIVDTIPGDAGYSPFWAMFFVPVTSAYAGEQITSVAAIDEAVALGIVELPEAQPFAVNCPAVASDVLLDIGDGRPPISPPSRFYVSGRTVAYFDLGMMPLEPDRVSVPEARRYELRREGGEPLSEPVRGIDLVGDGDLVDTNDVYERAANDPARSPLCRTVRVAVPASTSSIDTSQDDGVAQLRSAEQLFSPAPVAGTVVAYSIEDELINCAAQRTPAGL